MKPIIETERLILREKTMEDKEELFALHTDPEVQKYTGESVVESIEVIENALKRRVRDYKKYGYGRWLVEDKMTKECIGWAGLLYLPEFDKIDIGYRFHQKHWGKGYATEASKAILEYGFNTLNLDLIIAIAMPDNLASIRVMEKIGMKFDKQAPYDEEIIDAIWYKISKSDYNNKTSNL